jgi:hypothetical protein
MAEYTKDKGFSIGWVIGGTLLMFITSFFGGFVLTGLAVDSVWARGGVSIACFAIGGFVVGWKSEGSTILEAGIAALLTIGGLLAIAGFQINTDPQALAITFAIPFVAAMLGAWIGEKVQGDVIVTRDD